MSAVPLDQDETALSLRRCALMLHGVSAGDQAWLLERIAEPHRTRVSALLQELRALGIPPEKGAVQQAIAGGPPRAASQPQELLAQAPAARLADVLKDEPGELVACLIQAGPWRWKDAFIALLAPGQRAQVQKLLGSRVFAPKLADSVVHAVAARLAIAEAPVSNAKARPLFWPRWFGRLAVRSAGGDLR